MITESRENGREFVATGFPETRKEPKEELMNEEGRMPQNAFAVVVNDDATQLNLISVLLRKAGLETRLFSGAEVALAAMTAWERESNGDSDAMPALIVTDLHMPGIDGWRLCRLLRSPDYAAFNRIPILVVSATYGGEEAELIAADLGADGFLSSQLDGVRFIGKIRSLLRGASIRERLRVLIIEDGEALAAMLKETFEESGYQPEAVGTVEEAAEAFHRSSFDVAVIDYRLPDGNGGRLLDLFRKERPDCVCVMMTADPDPRLALDWMKRGAAAFLRKPFDPEYLIEICAKARRERSLLGVQDRLEERTRELRLSEERLRLVVAGANLGTWDWHVPTGAVIVNERWAEMLGYSPEEIEPHVRAWEALIHPEDRPRVMAALQFHLDGLTNAYEAEQRLLHKSGDWVWVLDKGRVIERDAQGNPVRMCGTHMDITELKRADEARRDKERQFESLFMESPVSIIIHDKNTGEIIEANPTAVSSYGFSSIEELKANDFWAEPPYSAEEALGWIRKTALEGPQQFEWLNRKRTGEAFWEQVRLVPVNIGGVDRILATGIDITARREAEEGLRASKARYQELISNISDIVWRYEVDECGQFVGSYISTALDRILGLPEGTVGCGPDAFLSHVHPEDIPAVKDTLESGLASLKQHESVEYRLCRADGAPVWVRSHGSARRQPNGHVVAFGTTTDITELKRTESRLKESETNFRTFFETMTDMVMVATPEGRILYCNSAVEKKLGYRSEELIAMHIPDLHPREVRGEAERIFAAMLRGERDTCPLPIVAKGGAIFAVETRAWLGKWNERDCVFGISKDLTAEREAQQRFESLFRHNPASMALSSSPDRRFVDVNDAFLKTLGYDVSEVIGRSSAELGLFPDSRQQAVIAEKLEHEGRISGFELQVRRKDGKILEGLFSGEVVDAQRRRYFLTVMVDVTERKQMEEALRTAEETYRNIFINSQIGLFRLEMESGMLLEANNAQAAFLGYPDRDSLLAEPFGIADQYVDAKDRVRMLRLLKAHGEVRDYEARFKRKDGSTFWMRNSARLVPSKGWIEGVSEDVTELKKAEADRERLRVQLAQAQKMESVGRLAGGVAHDFNNMLGVILGHTEMAMDETSPPQPIYSDLLEIQKAAKRSADLTQQLLTFARKQIVSPKVLNLNEIMEDMLRMLRRLIGEDIEMVWLPGGGLWSVKIDPSQIHQMLANLCVNARDAISGTGSIVIETKNVAFGDQQDACREGSIRGDCVMIAVIDDGCGMDEKTVGNLFEPFFTTKGVGEGTGLGLATVDGIVKQNGGFIDVLSEPGKGTTFNIHLPRYLGEEGSTRETAEMKSVPGGWESILLVEDEEAVRTVTKRLLERLGYRVMEANSPKKALQLADEHAGGIDLLMTDLIMPEMNGKQLAERLLSRYSRLNVLFSSGYTADVIARHGVLETGMHFIEKPFSAKRLAAKVREALTDGH